MFYDLWIMATPSLLYLKKTRSCLLAVQTLLCESVRSRVQVASPAKKHFMFKVMDLQVLSFNPWAAGPRRLCKPAYTDGGVFAPLL